MISSITVPTVPITSSLVISKFTLVSYFSSHKKCDFSIRNNKIRTTNFLFSLTLRVFL